MFVTRKGGKIVTCASTSGYMHEYDNRYLWMNLKRIIGSHFANYREAFEANRLIDKGFIHPTLSKVTRWRKPGRRPTTSTGTCTGEGRRAGAGPEEGLGVRDEAKRALHIDEINRFRDV